MDLAWLATSRLFQSTLSQGERPTGAFTMTGFAIFQSTLSQGERHTQTAAPLEPTSISIHALARRATATYSTRVFYT